MKRHDIKLLCMIMICVCLSVAVIYFIISVFSSCILMDQITPWLEYNRLECEKVPLEIWFRPDRALVHKFPFITYAEFTIAYLHDGKMSCEDVINYIKQIAAKSDEEFKGNETKVEILSRETEYGKLIYVEFRKRCVSPIKFLS